MILQLVCLIELRSNESWVRSSFWCLEYVVLLYLRCFLGVCVSLCWAVGYVSFEFYVPLIGFGIVGVRIHCPGRVCHGVERSG